MKEKDFNVDEYLSNAKYSEVRRNSPELSSNRPPTFYSPDEKWIYLSSQDLLVSTKDIDELKSVLQTLSKAYKNAKTIQTTPHIAFHKIRVDCIEVCNLIAGQVENPGNYNDPDIYL